MEQHPFFSVVIPVYRAESFLEDTVQSVLSQTYTDFELILVDDHSPDRSGELCDSFSDPRVKVIHLPENQGQSAARNRGFEEVKGAYVLFMDADDTVDAYLFEQAAASLSKNPADFVMWGLIEEYLDETGTLTYTVPVSYPDTVCVTAADVRDRVMEWDELTLFGYLWNKFYRVELIRELNLTHRPLKLAEDFLYNARLIGAVSCANVLSATPYHYKHRKRESVTNSYTADYYDLHEMRVQTLYDLHREWDMYTPPVRTKLANTLLRYLLSALQRNCDPQAKMSHKDRLEAAKNYCERPLSRELIPAFASQKAAINFFGSLCLKKRYYTMLLMARFVYLVKEKLPFVFARLKKGR